MDKSHTLTSKNRMFQMRIENDGRMVIRRISSNEILWASSKTSNSVTRLCSASIKLEISLFGAGANRLWGPNGVGADDVLLLGTDANLSILNKGADPDNNGNGNSRRWSSNSSVS